MKKFTSFLSLVVIAALYQPVFAQVAKRYVLFEHFTQASCGPCAAQNPAFQDNILAKNQGVIHHVAYHTSWPGTDPMYSHNTTQSAEMVSYYNVSAVPKMFMLGTRFSGSPAAVTQSMIDDERANGSPIQVLVADVDSSGTQKVSVTINSIGTPPSGNYVLKVAVVEKVINYTNPPGTNGEKMFPNVFRKMLTSTSGNTITLPAQGNGTTVNFTYTNNAAWKAENIYVLAWVQNSDTKEIENSGSDMDPRVDVAATGGKSAVGTQGVNTNFNIDLKGVFTSEQVQVVLVKDAPATWEADYNDGTSTYTDTALVTADNVTPTQFVLRVYPGADAAVGKYTLYFSTPAHPEAMTLQLTFYVVSGVTDLVVDNDGAFAWEALYDSGLDAAGNTKNGIVNAGVYNELASQLGSTVKNIYWNAAWNFPSLTDEIVSNLSSFIDNGGNLLIAGQDMGWETWDAASTYWTANTRDFYTNYLKATYVADGSTANNKLIANTSDAVYGAIATSNVVDKYSGNMYPDELTPLAGAYPCFYYNTAKTKVGAVRSTGAGKVAYFGIGLEMISTAAVRDAIIKQTHDWFYGLVSIDNILFDAHISIAPNPVTDKLSLSFELGAKQQVSYSITNVLGEVVKAGNLDETTSGTVQIDLSENPAGVYFANIITANGTAVKKFVLGN